MTPRRVAVRALLWSPLVIVLALIGALVGHSGQKQHAKVYSSTAVIYVGTPTPTADPVEEYDISAFDQLILTLCDMVPSSTIARQALAAPGIDRTVGQTVSETMAHPVIGSDLIDVTVTDGNRVVAAELANRMAGALVNYVHPPSGTAPPGLLDEPVSVFQPAGIPSSPVAVPGHRRRVLEGAVLGAVIGLLAIWLIESLRRPGPAPAAAGTAGGPDDI